MDSTPIFISRELYDDIVRFADGKLRPDRLAEDLLENWIASSAEAGDEHWGQRLAEVREKYRTGNSPLDDWRQVLVWKGLSFPSGTAVRMTYAGIDHLAEVKGGKIVDRDGAYTPSEWASKVAQGTSRNAWRDLWLKLPGSPHWTQASKFRSRTESKANEFRSAIIAEFVKGKENL